MSHTALQNGRRGLGRVQPAAFAALLLAAGAAGGAASAAAQGYGGRYDGRPSYVVAESQWGHGTISGPVRPGRHGWQVRMPRGTWIDCVRSCSDTLRRQTVDYWESNGSHAPGSGRGYLNWEFRF